MGGENDMKCGYCREDMIEGYITTPALEWIPRNSKNQLIYRGEKKKGFKIGKHSLFSMREQAAWYCPKCDCIIIDCKE